MPQSRMRIILVLSVLSLTGCAPPSDLHQIQHEIKTLNQDMMNLSQQAIILNQQNALNAQSTEGAYLLPNADASALLESQIGTLRMSLTRVIGTPHGTQVTLLIQDNAQRPLPAFSGVIAWKTGPESTDAASNAVDDQQSFTAPAARATPGEATLTLVLPDITPENLRWVRIHGIHPVTETALTLKD